MNNNNIILNNNNLLNNNNNLLNDHNIKVDDAHAGKPVHIDITVPLSGMGIPGAHKIGVDGSGTIIEDTFNINPLKNGFLD